MFFLIPDLRENREYLTHFFEIDFFFEQNASIKKSKEKYGEMNVFEQANQNYINDLLAKNEN